MEYFYSFVFFNKKMQVINNLNGENVKFKGEVEIDLDDLDSNFDNFWKNWIRMSSYEDSYKVDFSYINIGSNEYLQDFIDSAKNFVLTDKLKFNFTYLCKILLNLEYENAFTLNINNQEKAFYLQQNGFKESRKSKLIGLHKQIDNIEIINYCDDFYPIKNKIVYKNNSDKQINNFNENLNILLNAAKKRGY